MLPGYRHAKEGHICWEVWVWDISKLKLFYAAFRRGSRGQLGRATAFTPPNARHAIENGNVKSYHMFYRLFHVFDLRPQALQTAWRGIGIPICHNMSFSMKIYDFFALVFLDSGRSPGNWTSVDSTRRLSCPHWICIWTFLESLRKCHPLWSAAIDGSVMDQPDLRSRCIMQHWNQRWYEMARANGFTYSLKKLTSDGDLQHPHTAGANNNQEWTSSTRTHCFRISLVLYLHYFL